jgi:hypothetical protein
MTLRGRCHDPQGPYLNDVDAIGQLALAERNKH